MPLNFMLKRIYWFIRLGLTRRFYPRTNVRVPVELHGSVYGGWAIASSRLTEKSVVYSVGIGTDASFDLSLIKRYGCAIYGFDPTPKSKDWVFANIDDPRFHFHPWALGRNSGSLVMFLPKNESHVSGSFVKGDHLQGEGISVEAYSFDDILQKLGHVYVDVLKMDIEGGEYIVIEQLIDTGALCRVGQLLIEFHHFFPSIGDVPTRKAIADLKAAGWGVAWHSPTGREVLFVKSH